MAKRFRLGVVTTHPIQYQAPLWRRLGESRDVEPMVFFLSRHGAEPRIDPSFGKEFAWDIPLLDGYPHEFLSSVPRPGTKKDTPWGPTGALFSRVLTARFRHGKFDAVLVHGYASGAAWAGTLGAWRTRTSLILRGESHDRGRQPSFWQTARRWALSRWMRHIDMVVAIGQLNRELWRGLGVPEDRILVSPYAIDNERFRLALNAQPERAGELRRSWGVGREDVVFLFAGKLTSVKAPEILLAAFASLPAAAAAHLVFVGAGPLEGQLRAFQTEAGLTRVHWAGFVNQTEIPHYYRAADVLVLPSRREPWGLVVNEAMACGTPCIVSDRVGSGPDLVEGFASGAVFPAGDGAALRCCLEDALDPDRRRNWVARLDEFRDQVNLDRNVDVITRALEILSARSSGSAKGVRTTTTLAIKP